VSSPDAFGLTRLFISPYNVPRPAALVQDIAGGTMTAWDPISHANTVIVGPVTYQNLPVVSPIGLTLGNVLLNKGPAGYIIMGMLSSASTQALDPIRFRVLKSDVPLPSTTLIDAGTLAFQLAAGVNYGLDGTLYMNAGVTSDVQFAWTGPPNMVVKWNMLGLNNSSTNTVGVPYANVGYGDANPQTVQGAGVLAATLPNGWFSTTDTPGILQLRVALASGTTAGLLGQGSWLRLCNLDTGNVGTDTYTKVYTCTASRSYDDSGNPIGGTDQDNNVYFGSFSDRSFGNERAVMIFPGATMRSDLAGATVLSAQLFMYCFKAKEAKGSWQGKSEPYTAVPATYNPSGGFGVNDVWDVNSWNSVECFYMGAGSSIINRILAGDSAVGLTPTSFGLAATGFRGYGFSATYRPYVQVTYAI
jgi:hypothetical protein